MSAIAPSRQETAEYYQELTGLYQWYGGAARGWHYGIYDGASDHRTALVRSNEVLLEGIVTSAGCRVLDVGFGSGGFSVWAAEHGCRVTGITICPGHVPLARSLAASRGVADRCSFLVMDMDAMAFRPGSFDVVVNQETLCHSQAKLAYCAAVWRLLGPGGVFRSVDLSLRDGERTPSEERRYQSVIDGFKIASLASETELRDGLDRAGFEGVMIRDFRQRVRKTARQILTVSAGPYLLGRIGLDRLLYRSRRRRHYQGHVAACVAFNYGLERGLFRYLDVTARRPI